MLLALIVGVVAGVADYLIYRAKTAGEGEVRTYLRSKHLASVVHVRLCRHSPDPDGSVNDYWWCELNSRRSLMLDEVRVPKGFSIICFAVPRADRYFTYFGNSVDSDPYPVHPADDHDCFRY